MTFDVQLFGNFAMWFVEAFGLYIVVRAICEAYQTNRSNFDDYLHKRAHIAALGAIAAYNLYDIGSFIYFRAMNQSITDFSISFFNLLTLNILWLFIIDHFKQERKGDIKISGWTELFKF